MALRLNTEMADDELRATYRQLNAGKPRHYVHHLTSYGFGANMKLIVGQMMYCLKNDIEFRLCLEWHETPQQQIFNECMNLTDAFTIYEYPFRCLPWMVPFGRRTMRQVLGKTYMRLRADVPYDPAMRLRFKHIDHYNYLSGLIDGRAESNVTTLLRIVYNPKQEVLQQVERVLARLDKPYIAVHIRRGDKPVDHLIFDKPDKHYILIADFWQAVANLDSAIKNVVVATDDFSAFEEFKAQAPAGYSVSTFCPPNRLGHDPHRFERLDADTRQSEFLNWFVDMELLLRADLALVADYSSYGSLVGFLRAHRQVPTVVAEKVVKGESKVPTIKLRYA